MANSDKKKSLKASKKGPIITGIIVTVFVLIIIGFFVYISGILPKTVTGIKVTQTPDGAATKYLENISVLEANYHFNEVYNSYSSSGYVNKEMLDQVADEATGKTYYQLIMDSAANEIMNMVLVNRLATEAGYEAHSGADRYAEMNVETLRLYSSLYGFQTADQYLQAMYGTGMTVRLYQQFMAREIMTTEYEQYIRQYVLTATEEEIQAAYDADPTVYLRADFNYYFFAGDTDEEGNVDTTAAEATAQRVVNASSDSDSFRAAVMATLEDEDPALQAFADDANPTFMSGYSKGTTDYMATGLTSFIFVDGEIGEGTVLVTSTGAYAVLLDDRYVDETPTVAYRTLTLTNEAISEEGATPESISAGLAATQQEAQTYAAVSDSLAFTDNVKLHTTAMNEIVSGGYHDGVTMDSFTVAEDGTLSANDAQLSAWLFDEARVQGDTLILASEDARSVTVYYFENCVPAWMNTARNTITTGLVNAWSSDTVLKDNPDVVVAYQLISDLTY